MIVATNAKKWRKRKKFTLKELSARSGVSYGSLRRFESTGEISFASLLSIAFVLECMEDFEPLFVNTHPTSIKEVIDGQL